LDTTSREWLDEKKAGREGNEWMFGLICTVVALHLEDSAIFLLLSWFLIE